MAQKSNVICLFDIDGTLTLPRQQISDEMESVLQKLKEKVTVALVGGSDLAKISEQMSIAGQEVTQRYEYVFSENGLVAHRDGKLLAEESILKFMGEEKLQEFINYALKCLSELTLPCKRGNFIEFRKGLINVCPVGRSCSQAERDEFAAYDKAHNIRQALVDKFKKQFADAGLRFVIGGQISIDVFPEGWDKRFCLRYVEGQFSDIHFFGDKTMPGGNDHEIFEDPRTKGHTVTCPTDTIKLLRELFLNSS